MATVQPNPALLGTKGAFIADVLRQMTLDEKIGQLRLIRFGPLIAWSMRKPLASAESPDLHSQERP